MPPPRIRRVKSLAGSDESGPSTITMDTTSGDEAAGPPVSSPPLRKAHLGSPGETGDEEGGSGSCSGCGKGDTARKAAVHPAKSGEGEKGVASVDVGEKKADASKARSGKGGASNRKAPPKGGVVVGGGAVSHIAAVKRITGCYPIMFYNMSKVFD